MRGRPGCPTEQEKKPVGATVSNPPVLQGKVGYQIAPSSAPVCALGHLPPEGKALGREEPSVADFRPSQGPEQNPICFLHGHAPGKKLCSPRECQLRWRGSGCIPQFWEPSVAGPKIPASPSPPSRWAGRYGRKIQGRRPGRKKERTPCRVLKTRVGSPEGRNSPLWPSFPPFLGRNGGPRRVGALRGAAPRGWSKPRPPEGYAVPHRSPARSRAGTHVAGLDLRWSQRNHLPMAPPPKAVQGTGPAGPIPAPVSAYLTVLPPARWRTGSLAPPIPPGAGKTLSPRCSGR